MQAQFRVRDYVIAWSKISIGNRVVIRPAIMLFADPRKNGAGVIIEDDVLIDSGVHIYDGNHKFADVHIKTIDQDHSSSKEIIFKKVCWFAANAIIFPEVVIDENSIVGAGSVVKKSVFCKTVVAGNPADIIRDLSSLKTYEV